MRTIKFKGKRVDTKEWVYGFLVIGNSGEYKKVIYEIFTGDSGYGFEEGIIYERYEVVPETVGQFTGLTDKNGKEIYEDDIVKTHYFYEDINPFSMGTFENENEVIGKVVIGEFGTYTEGFDGVKTVWAYCIQEPSEEIEVIGNIHDNPELLK